MLLLISQSQSILCSIKTYVSEHAMVCFFMVSSLIVFFADILFLSRIPNTVRSNTVLFDENVIGILVSDTTKMNREILCGFQRGPSYSPNTILWNLSGEGTADTRMSRWR